ncbi:MAG: hypothetical protein KAR35_06055 [Candidatus Heimdallarchaeota archaeon]|nr:hypothetical protein [Candidatus Heimdallarchaeota archaeon]MCK5048922.1 hypothetical protein [Candidatus Heimdallarchaeota archaeon]
MITINVELSGVVRNPFSTRKFSKKVELETSLHKFLSNNGFNRTELRYLFVSVNRKKVDLTYQLIDGDNLFITVPAGGG